MGRREFGQMVEQARIERGWTRAKLAAGIGILPDGGALDATQVRRLVEGGRVLDPDLVNRLIELLDLVPEDAWKLSGLWPPGLTAEQVRKLGLFRRRRSDRQLEVVPADVPAEAVTSDQQGSTMGQWTVPAGSRELVAA